MLCRVKKRKKFSSKFSPLPEMSQVSPLVALAGSPNCGKTSLFNALTGTYQKVGNYPGVTVEKKSGEVRKEGRLLFEVIDLPGSYSLDSFSMDERITSGVLLGRSKDVRTPDALIVVVDSTNLERSLYLAMELLRLNYPLVVALNLYDVALNRGLSLDLEALSAELGVPVVSTVAVDAKGISDLTAEVEVLLEKKSSVVLDPEVIREFSDLCRIEEKFSRISEILSSVTLSSMRPDSLTESVDRILLNPFFGVGILLFVLLIIFQAVFSWAEPLMGGIESLVGWLSALGTNFLPEGYIRGFVVDGILAGVGNVIIFLPQILILFFFILLLEDVGYLGRAAFLMDGLLRKFGLPGKAVLPLLSSHACAIPGIMATRTLENEKDRIITMLVAPLTTCSARIPVYTLLIAAFIPNDKILGPFLLPALVMLGLYLSGMFFALIMAMIFRKTAMRGYPSLLLMELPPYRLPRFKNLMVGLWYRAKVFLQRAGSVILVSSMILWVLVSFPKPPADFSQPAVEYSFAARIGRTIEPVFAPLGFDWRISTALIPSMGAREIVVAALGTVLAVEESGDEAEFERNLSSRIASTFGIATGLSLMVWFIFSPQCISTFAIMRRETGGWKWPVIMGAYTFGLAYLGSFLTYRISSVLLGSG